MPNSIHLNSVFSFSTYKMSKIAFTKSIG